ncbi:MAG: V-type ATP synthase subunit A, partial [Clostridia bacterium]|nr:V-type ATP synthase subunit A [Clostridia bacterium]
ISEPVSQATLRIVKVFWGLDSALAYARHFPAVNWLNSYSLYKDRLEEWYNENISKKWSKYAAEMLRILQKESELDEIVKLVGVDALSGDDRLTLEVSRSIREDFLQQDAFNIEDSFTSLPKQYALIDLILFFRDRAKEAMDSGADVQRISELPVREDIGRAKTVSDAEYREVFDGIKEKIEQALAEITPGKA